MPQRNYLITGVSSGFGRIMTEQLLVRGDRVVGRGTHRFPTSQRQGRRHASRLRRIALRMVNRIIARYLPALAW